MKTIAGILLPVATVLVIWMLDHRIGPLPPLGRLLSPAQGIWNNAESPEPATAIARIPGLKAPVMVRYDSLRIPHIFAGNDHDLYFTQGYVTARDRLWQMDIQVRKAAGTLAEILGRQLADQDIYYRRIGLTESAKASLAMMLENDTLKTALEAYSAGVNAYIASLPIEKLPLEFKILSYAPAHWTPLHSVLIMKLFAETLCGASDDMAMSNTLAGLGPAAVHDLFPDDDGGTESAVPAGTKWKGNKTIQPPGVRNRTFGVRTLPLAPGKQHIEGIGSNCWVVGRTKTRSGFPLLANDPHLALSFPSIWYQLQVQDPGMNAYGVSIPGIPFVVIGMNTHITWGVTNVDADVLDWYSIKFRDRSRSVYAYDNGWRSATKRIEHIRVRDAAEITDTVITTHYGPIVYEQTTEGESRHVYNYDAPEGYAMHWTANEPSQELLTFYLLNKAESYPDFRRALSFFHSPAQNFLFADSAHIAYAANGEFPLKARDQGKFLLDGSLPANEWRGTIPMTEVPSVEDPARDYLFSANQSPVDSSYPYYLNWQFAGPERARRIHEVLARGADLTPDDMRALQNDNYSILAGEILDTLLSDIKDLPTGNAFSERCRDSLLLWDRYYQPGSAGATLFTAWWNEQFNRTWKDEFGGDSLHRKYPSRERTVQLILKESRSKWFDDIRTTSIETRQEISKASFTAAISRLEATSRGIFSRLQWSLYKNGRIDHLLRLPGLGSGYIEKGGSSMAVDAMVSNFGPSWRMVTVPGKKMQGAGIFPGGESGNPGSAYYDNFLPSWLSGRLVPFFYLQNENELLPGQTSKLLLQP